MKDLTTNIIVFFTKNHSNRRFYFAAATLKAIFYICTSELFQSFIYWKIVIFNYI